MNTQPIHSSLAERGKIFALAGQHDIALKCYRQSMRMTVAAAEPEIIFRHYLNCAIESLEKMGFYQEVLDYCDRLIGFYADKPDLELFWRCDLAATHERRGAILLKSGRKPDAIAALRTALDLAEANQQSLPLADSLLGWLQRGLHVDAQRVVSEQNRHKYFSIRADTVDPLRALALDNPILRAYKIL